MDAASPDRDRDLALITDSLPALVSYVGADGRYRFVNHSYERFFGHSRDQIRGKHLREVLGEATWEVIRPFVERVLKGERVDYEARLPYQYGGARDVLASYLPSVLEDGTIDGFIVFVNDITERKRLETELHEAEHRIAGVLDTVNEGYLTLDAAWRVTYFNAAAERYFGRPRAEILGRHLLEAFPQIAGSDFERAYANVFATKEPVVLHTRGAVHRDRYVETRIYAAGEGLVVFFRDVTEAHRAAEELRESEERIRLALHAASAGAWWWYDDGEIEWSPELYQLIGVDRSMTPTLEWFLSLVHPDDVKLLTAASQGALATHQPFESEFRFRNPDGSWRWFSVIARPIDSERRRGLVGVTQDITARRATQESIRRSERRYRTLVGTTTAIVWRCDAGGTFTERQERWEAYTGQGWPAHSGFGFLDMIHPDDRERVGELWRTSVRLGLNFEVEGRIWNAASQSYRAFIAHATPLRREDGTVDEWIGMVHDVDDTRHAAVAARVLAAADYALAGSLDRDATIRSLCSVVVDNFADWCLLALVENGEPRYVAGRHRDAAEESRIAEIVASVPTPRNAPALFEALRSGQPQLHARDGVVADEVHGGELLARGAESVICVPMSSRSTIIGALVCVSALPERRYSERDVRLAVDVANRAALALDNARLYEASQAATRAKDEFLAVVSHELRTPMTSIIGWTGLLKLGTPDDETVRLALEAIASAARAQAAIVDDLLEVSRIITGKLKIETQITTVIDALTKAVETVGSAAVAKGVSIETALHGPVSLVAGDPARLQQVFWNLLTNAVKFTPPGGRVLVTVEHPEGAVRVTFRDTGCGIEPAFLPLVFDRFAQEQSAITRAHSGLGLGLSIARSIVELHGGTISAASDGVGKGATFTVSIPSLRPALPEDVLPPGIRPRRETSTT